MLSSSNHSYIIYTPYGLYLWHGSAIDGSRKKGSLHILKSFLNSRLYESINYQPSYRDPEHQNIYHLRFRVENQGYESQRLRSLLTKSVTYGNNIGKRYGAATAH